MGPNFNFYKFKNMHDQYSVQYDRTQKEMLEIDSMLLLKNGDQSGQTRFQIRRSIQEMRNMMNSYHSEGVKQDTKAISPFLQSKEEAVYSTNKPMTESPSRSSTGSFHEQNHMIHAVDQSLQKIKNVKTAHRKAKKEADEKKEAKVAAKVYVPKFVREISNTSEAHRKQLAKYNWQRKENRDILTQFLNKIIAKFNGNKEEAAVYLEKIKKQGILKQIATANSFPLGEVIQDRQDFISQLNEQFGGADVNELISMQIDEFKFKQ